MDLNIITALQYANESQDYDTALVNGIILGSNGIFEKHETSMGTVIGKVNDFVINEDATAVEESIVLNELEHKVPRQALADIIKYYHLVNEKMNHNEAQAIIFYNHDGIKSILNKPFNAFNKRIKEYDNNIVVYIPLQWNTGCHTEIASNDRRLYEALKKSMTLIVETHSHNVMKAFRSGEDELNSSMDALQLVFGEYPSSSKNNKGKRTMFNWASLMEHQVELVNVDAFVEWDDDLLTESVYLELGKVPSDWLDACVDRPAPVVPKVQKRKVIMQKQNDYTRRALDNYEKSMQYMQYTNKDVESVVDDIISASYAIADSDIDTCTKLDILGDVAKTLDISLSDQLFLLNYDKYDNSF